VAVTKEKLNRDLLLGLQKIAKFLRLYHRHEVIGLDHFPKEGAVILAVNHSLATYDICLLFDAIYEHSGRICRPLVDRLFYKIPYLGDLVQSVGAREGSNQNAKKLLAEGHILTIAPGGMRESLRPSSEKYQIRWQRRMGFVRLALETQTPIILATCPKADDLYEVYPSTITSQAYKFFRVPLFLASGLAYTALPRPVKLVHSVSEPIWPPKLAIGKEEQEQQLKNFHAEIIKRMEALTKEAVERETTF